MEIAYPEPTFRQGISIYVSKPVITKASSSAVIDSMKKSSISSKSNSNHIFEDNLKSYFDVPVACSVSNGYTGLYVILKSLKMLKSTRNQIILPDSTMVAVLNSVLDNNFEPVLVDNDKDRLNPSIQNFFNAVSERTLAMIVTHTYGVPLPNFQLLVKYCEKHDIFLIEDIAEAIGVKYKEKLLGTYGNFASASLYANKLITCGDGGFIFSRMQKFLGGNLQQIWKSLINHGFSSGYHFNHMLQSGNYRINGLGAAFISNFSSYINQFISQRKQIDRLYRLYLSATQNYILMENNSGGDNTPWVFSLLVKNKEVLVNLRQHLADYGIQTRPFFKPLSTQPIIKIKQQFVYSILQYQTGFYLPTYHEITPEMQKYIADCLNGFFQKDKKFKFQTFIHKQSRLIDMISEQQLQQIISNLIEDTNKKCYSLSRSANNFQTAYLLKQLEMTIRKSQTLQIKQYQIQEKLQKKEQPHILSQRKKITMRKEENKKEFGKLFPTFNRSLLDLCHKYKDYFQIEITAKDEIIQWENQYDKRNSIEQIPNYDIQKYKQQLSCAIAQQIHHFHSISRQFSKQLLESKFNTLLKVRIVTLKQKLQQYSCSLKFNKQTLDIFNSIVNTMIEKQEQTSRGEIGLIHGSLSTYKMIYQTETKKIRLYDFENIRVDQLCCDLALIENKYHLNQLNQLIINEYIRLRGLQQKEGQIKSRIVLIKVCQLFESLFAKRYLIQKDDLMFRQLMRKCVNLAIQQLKLFELNKYRNLYFTFENKNYQKIQLRQKIDKKFKINEMMGWNHHNGGWNYVETIIQHYCASKSGTIRFISALEKSFYSKIITQPINEKWCAFIHNVPMNGENCCSNLQTLFNDSNFLNSLQNCVGLFCLSEEIKKHVSDQFPDIYCEKIYYPLTPPQRLFIPELVLNKQKISVVHIGQYMRDIECFKRIKVGPGCQKFILPCQDIQKGSFSLGGQTEEEGIWLQKMSGLKYEELLSSSVVLLKLKGAGGCTTVIECIARNIPIVVNRLPALEEYLGKNYPLFYDTETFAQSIFKNNFKQKILQAYDYLIRMNKQNYYPQQFLKSLGQSYTYQTISTPNNEKEQFRQFDITILLISYKRQFNIKEIVSRLANQTFTGTIELIIWNNNSTYSLRFLESQFNNKFDNFVIIQTTFNYYCYVRSAIANLGRGKILLFTDDDILPKPIYVESYYKAFYRVQAENQNQNVIITLKGNTFHSFHPKFDAHFWSNFDNVHFIGPQDEEQQIHVIHMDTCMMKRNLMIKCASYEIPELDYILVDDYWYSFVLSSYLKAKIIKVKLQEQIFDQCPSSQNQNIALYKQNKVTKQKNRFFTYHSNKNWPYILSRDAPLEEEYIRYQQETSLRNVSTLGKNLNDIIKIYSSGFSGFNIGSGIWKNALNDLYNKCKCKIVRIGVVDSERQFLCFYQKDGIHLAPAVEIHKKLKSMNNSLVKKDIKYIITLRNLPGKNEYTFQDGKQKDLWLSDKCLEQLYILWEIIAGYLVDAQNCIGYDLINQPVASCQEDYMKIIEVYKNLIQRIRKVDKITPIILQSQGGHYSQLQQLIKQINSNEPQQNIIYSFHFYDPYVWTSARNRNLQLHYEYPGPIPELAGSETQWCSNTKFWNIQTIRAIFLDVNKLKQLYGLLDHQILLGEYGCRIDRQGITAYFTDLLTVCHEFKINRFAYAYRQEWWQKMNYQYYPEAFNILKSDFSKYFTSYNLEVEVNAFLEQNHPEAQWLEYNPFYFEIKHNEDKRIISRIPYQISNQIISQSFNINPVYVVGCGRSGTTFLLKILSFSSTALCLHEPLSLWLSIFPQFNIWSKEETQYLQVDSDYCFKEQKRVNKLKSIYSFILKKSGKTIIVDKQPQNVFRLEFLKASFPQLKIIYIEREKNNVTRSINKFTPEQWYGKDNIKYTILAKQMKCHIPVETQLERAAVQWDMSRFVWQQFKKKHPQIKKNIFELSFEDLINNSFSVIKNLCQFLSLSSTDFKNIYNGFSKIVIKN